MHLIKKSGQSTETGSAHRAEWNMRDYLEISNEAGESTIRNDPDLTICIHGFTTGVHSSTRYIARKGGGLEKNYHLK